MPIEISAVFDDASSIELRDLLYAYNKRVTGYGDAAALSCFLRDDDGALIAGIDGFTWGGYARVETLWVHEEQRGRGLGQALLVAAEDEARRRGCRTIVLETHDFQAPDFYPRFGYEIVGATDDTPSGYRELLLQKRL